MPSFQDFIYTRYLLFANKALQTSTEHHLLSSSISTEALNLGEKYDRELTLGYEVPSQVLWVHPEVGFGLYTLIDLDPGSFVGEYTGLIRESSSYDSFNDYLFSYPVPSPKGSPLSIDAKPYGNKTRFINHSFHPNLDRVYAYHQGLYHLILITNRPISKGTHLSYHYGHGYWYLRGAPKDISN